MGTVILPGIPRVSNARCPTLPLGMQCRFGDVRFCSKLPDSIPAFAPKHARAVDLIHLSSPRYVFASVNSGVTTRPCGLCIRCSKLSGGLPVGLKMYFCLK